MNHGETVIGSALRPHPDTSLRRQAWTMVALAMLGTMCCSTSVVLINVGVFMKPLADSFGWSRGAIALSLSIAALSMALVNPFVGRMIDRWGVRPVLIGSLILYGAATAMLPLLIGVVDLWGLYIGYALIAGVGAGSNVIAYVRVLSGWFSGEMNNSRGLALGISSAGIPLGAALSGPIGVLLIEQFGWQGGYYGLALAPLLLGLPIAVFGIRMAPGELRTAGAGMADLPGMTFKEAMNTRAFWILVVIVLLMSSCLQGLSIHVAPLLSDYNLDANMLALVLFMDGVLGIVGRIGAGYLFDKFFAPKISVLIFGIAAISSLAMVGLPGLTVAIIATLLITIGSGAESDLVGYLVGRYFGLKCYGQIFGAIYGMFMVGIALGPYLFGVAFDIWGDYKVPFTFAGVGLAILCGLLLLLPRFPDEPKTEEVAEPRLPLEGAPA